MSISETTEMQNVQTSIIVDIKNQTKDTDVFRKAVDIAAVADRAIMKCEDAKNRVRFIEELAKRAKEISNDLQNVAATLAQTATAVAAVAIEICSYNSYTEAFQSNASYSKTIDLNTFLEIVDRGCQSPVQSFDSDEELNSLCPSDSRSAELSNHREPLVNSYSKESQCKHRPRRHSMDDACLLSHIESFYHDQSSLRLKSQAYSDTNPFNQNNQPNGWIKKQRSSSCDSSASADSNCNEKFSEKFPKQLAPDEYKDALGLPFNSVSSMSPLWEDRCCYLGELPTDKAKNAKKNGEPASWSEKKSMKQFQMRIQQRSPDHEEEDISDQPVTFFPSSTTVTTISTPSSAFQLPCEILATKPGAELKPEVILPEATATFANNYEVEYEPEVDSLLVGTKDVSRVRDIDLGCTNFSMFVPTNNNQRQRPISPLLNRDEKHKYGVIRESNTVSPNPEKHIFKPTVTKTN